VTRRTERIALALIALLSVVVRAAYARHVGQDPLIGDGLEFHLLANLVADGRGGVVPLAAAQGHVSPTADKPPLYTLTLTGLSALGLRSPGEHHVSGVLTGTACAMTVALLAREVAGRRVAGVVAGALCAVYPPLVMADGSLRSESLFALMVTGALLACVRYRRRPAARWAAAAAVAVALAALTRGEGILLAALLPLGLWRWRPAGARGAHAAVASAVLVLVLAPWLVRCWVVFDQPVAISTNTGGLIAGANCDETYRAGPLLGQWSYRCATVPTAEPNEARAADAARARGLRYARDHAGRLPVVLGVRLGRTFELYHPRRQAQEQRFYEGRALALARIAFWAFYVIVALGALALGLRRVARTDAAVLLAPVLVVTFVTLTAYGWTRLRVGAEPGLLVLATVGLLALADGARARWAARGAVSVMRSRVG
jgi:4-amino-4-deoxy-L-arabinose transferase-like glycosyltransferase